MFALRAAMDHKPVPRGSLRLALHIATELAGVLTAKLERDEPFTDQERSAALYLGVAIQIFKAQSNRDN
jgi:hypothetical protein